MQTDNRFGCCLLGRTLEHVIDKVPRGWYFVFVLLLERVPIMDQIILANQVKVGDLIRFCLRGYYFNNDPKWQEHCERALRVKHISPTPGGNFEFYFDDPNGVYREIAPDTEVILVNR